MIKRKEENAEDDRQAATRIVKGQPRAPEFLEVLHHLGRIKICLPANSILLETVLKERIARIGIRQCVHSGQKVLAPEERTVFFFIGTLQRLPPLQKGSLENLQKRKKIARNHPKPLLAKLTNQGRTRKMKTLLLARHLGLVLQNL